MHARRSNGKKKGILGALSIIVRFGVAEAWRCVGLGKTDLTSCNRILMLKSPACDQGQRTQEVTNNFLPEGSGGNHAEFTFRYCS